MKHLANDPAVSVNWGDPEFHRAAFYRACFFGHHSIVEFLLKHPRIEVNTIQKERATPFLGACWRGHKEMVSLLLADLRIDVNKPTKQSGTPFFMGCQKKRPGSCVTALE